LRLGGLRVLRQQGSAGNQHAWSAIPTLETMLFTKGILQLGHLATLGCQALYSGHTLIISLHGKYAARTHGGIVKQYSASTANAMLTAHMRARQTEVFSQKIEQGCSWFNIALNSGTIDHQLNGFFEVHELSTKGQIEIGLKSAISA